MHCMMLLRVVLLGVEGRECDDVESTCVQWYFDADGTDKGVEQRAKVIFEKSNMQILGKSK